MYTGSQKATMSIVTEKIGFLLYFFVYRKKIVKVIIRDVFY